MSHAILGYFEGWHLIYLWVPGIQHRAWYSTGTSECLTKGWRDECVCGKWMNECTNAFQPHRVLVNINSMLLGSWEWGREMECER